MTDSETSRARLGRTPSLTQRFDAQPIPASQASSGGSLLEVACRWSLQYGPVGGEPRAVQRAIPRLLKIVEADNAAEVGTHRRQCAGFTVDRRDGDRLTSLCTHKTGAFRRRPVLLLLLLQRVEFCP